MKWASIVACFIIGSNAVAQIESGTIIVIGYSENKIVIAADSRESTQEGQYRDNAHKITPLNDQLIFVASGKAKLIDRTTILWDASEEALAALSDTIRLPGDSHGAFIDRVASKWGRTIGENMSAHMPPKDAIALSNNQLLIDSLFIGVDEQRELHISHESIYSKVVDGTPKIEIKPVKKVLLPDAIEFTVMSESDIFNEFQLGESKRSKKWRQMIPRFAKNCGISDLDAAEAILLVNLTGEYGKWSLTTPLFTL